jgi:SapC
MASAPPVDNNLPLLFNDLAPLSSVDHATWRARQSDTAPFLTKHHAIPLTIDEFALAQRYYPIIFSAGETPVPLALMGLNEGVNTFVDDDGKLIQDVYVPAYVRRYPFLLAKLREDADELSLCFDPSADAIGPFDEGDELFKDGKPTESTQSILQFCEQFEQAGQRTTAFMQELVDQKLLMDGEVSIQTSDAEQPFIYRGFQMVNEEKLRELRGDSLRKMMKSGLLPLVHAHLFSLSVMREIFGRQMAQGKVPAQVPASS